MTIDVGDQKSRVGDLEPKRKRVDQRCCGIVCGVRYHDIGMRPNLKSMRRVGSFDGPTHAIPHPGCAMRHGCGIPEPPGEAWRPAGDGSASCEQSSIVTLRPEI